MEKKKNGQQPKTILTVEDEEVGGTDFKPRPMTRNHRGSTRYIPIPKTNPVQKGTTSTVKIH